MSSVPIYAIDTSCRSAECLRRWPVTSASASTAGQYKTKPPNLKKIETAAKQGEPQCKCYLLYRSHKILYFVLF